MKNNNEIQSAAKSQDIGKSPETISQESTLETSNGSATPSASKVGGDDIVQKRNKDKFIDKANKKFNNKFDYSKVVYINAKTPITIICPEHGPFEQTPDKHLQSKFGCKECAKKLKDYSKVAENSKKGASKRQLTKEEYIERANEKWSNKYTYIIDDWQGLCNSTIKVICPIHGEFPINARAHILQNNKTGCPKCGKEQYIEKKTDSYDEVLQQFHKIYGDLYEYPDSNREIYVNKRSKIDIICKEHGKFTKTAQKHMYQGCPICAIENVIASGVWKGGYCETLFDDYPELKDIPANLYYFKINNGQYYKIGISKNNPIKRANSLKSHAKTFGESLNFELIGCRQTTLYKAFIVEQTILEKLNKYRTYTKWSTELFKEDIYKFIRKAFERI